MLINTCMYFEYVTIVFANTTRQNEANWHCLCSLKLCIVNQSADLVKKVKTTIKQRIVRAILFKHVIRIYMFI